ncbi:hypothetical protein SAMN05444159_6129 [Bradyrhizobium lablabi]|uniref:Chlor_Arch_YYY domain-containing protein n=1 Tax=Bradyrhizobium lablabi TaxID=722472 RepID=A0A1M7BEI7_9BRAD|nr:hypothetical protein [Bradyrhizobium lablabi]SHL53412.1 hypothetical protein SAMN05444159_6129 [Bradyrhizobium lablabi]
MDATTSGGEAFEMQTAGGSAGARDFDRKWAVVALFGTGVSLFVALGCGLGRLGLSSPPLLLPLCVLIVAASLCGPLLVPARGWLADVRRRAIALPIIAAAMLLLVDAGLVLGKSGIALFGVVALLGLGRALGVARGSLRFVALGMLSFAVATYLFIVVHNLGYAGILSPEQSLLGLLNHDTRFHAAIAFIIENFGRPSIAVDGLLPLKYHFGSHYWFAGLSVMAGAEPAASYGAAVPVVAAPLLVTAAILCGLAADRGVKPVTHYLAFGLALVLLADSLDIKSYYISESYTFALIVLLLLLPVLANLARTDGDSVSDSASAAAAIIAIPLLCSLKVSVGILWTVSLGWVTLRRHGFAPRTIVIGLGCLAAILFAFTLFAPGPNDYQRASSALVVPFYYLRVDPELGSLASLLFPACLLLLRLHKSGSTAAFIRGRSELMTEAILIVAIVGAMPAMLGIPQDSSVWYFLNVCQWYAIGILPAAVTQDDIRSLLAGARRSPLFQPAMAVLAFVVAAQLVRAVTPTFFPAIGEMVRSADGETGGALLHGRSVSRYMLDTLKTERRLYGADFRDALAKSYGARLIDAVRSTPGSERPDFAVFVPPSNTKFWEFQTTCRDRHNVQVALTGRISLLGGPPASYHCARDAYTTPYGSDFDATDISDQELCAHARERGIGHVLILNDVANGIKNRMLACTD